jgi:hypothetical protein
MLIWELIKSFVLLIGVPAVLALCWIWLCLGIAKTGVRRVLAAIALQLSFVTAVFGLLHGHGPHAFLEALLPPVALPLSFGYLASFKLFLSQILPTAAAVGVLVFLALLAVPKVRIWAIAPAMLAFLFAATVVGERVSQRAMCSTAKEAGINEFWRGPLTWASLQQEGRDFGTYFHAVAEVNGKRLGWSYETMSWQELQPMPWYKMPDPVFDCGTVADASS